MDIDWSRHYLLATTRNFVLSIALFFSCHSFICTANLHVKPIRCQGLGVFPWCLWIECQTRSCIIWWSWSTKLQEHGSSEPYWTFVLARRPPFNRRLSTSIKLKEFFMTKFLNICLSQFYQNLWPLLLCSNNKPEKQCNNKECKTSKSEEKVLPVM